MNKPITKPISSPGRTTTEKFPPPLMRFLRSNVGNKSSRRRSRASPMFVRKKNTLFETTQEPSSPKVTCIGQVRVRRSKKTHQPTTHHQPHPNRLCRWLKIIKHSSCIRLWSKCVSFFRHGSCSCRNKNDCNSRGKKIEEKEESKDEDERMKVDNINEGLISRSTTLKEAFLLTRCRSAPYRSTSLGSIFRETMVVEEEEVGEKIQSLKIEKQEDEDEEKESKEVPLILSRCKSEPARRWDQLLPCV